MQEQELSCNNSHTKQIGIIQTKSYLIYVKVNHAEVSKQSSDHPRQSNMLSDSTHGSLALKAYQQNLYLEYYY